MAASRVRTRLATTSAVVAAASLLAACSSSPPGEATSYELSDEPVTIRVAWWGADTRHQLTEEALAVCTEQYPNITVEVEYGDMAGYVDRLATQIAGGDAPDVIQTLSRLIGSYGQRGALLDLENVSDFIDTSEIPEAILTADEINGVSYAVPVTKNAFGVFINMSLVEELGLPMPDSESWTWEDFADYGEQVVEQSGGEIYGVQQMGTDENLLNVWASQMGDLDGMYTPEGGVDIDPATVESFFQYSLDLQTRGIAPSAELTVEGQAGGFEVSPLGSNRALMGIRPAAEMVAQEAASGSDFAILPLPSHDPENSGQNFRAISWSIYSGSEHPAEAAQIVDCLQGDLDAGQILGAERGVPANAAVLASVEADLSPAELEVADFITTVEAVAAPQAPAPPPAGADGTAGLLTRIITDVFFETTTPAEASTLFIDELSSAVDNAR